MASEGSASTSLASMKLYKLIDMGSCVNIIFNVAFENMGLKTKPHPTHII